MKRRLLEATSTVTSTGTFTAQARKSFRFLALEFNSQNTNARTPIRREGLVPETKRAHGY